MGLQMHRVSTHSVPQLHSIFIEVTSACNCRCLHCRGNYNDQCSAQLDIEDIARLLREAKILGASYAVITGGEPLLHPRILAIVARATEMGVDTLLATNGFLLNSDLAQALSEFSRLSVQISLESSEQNCHDYLRGGKGLFEAAINAANLCRSFNIPFSTSMTLTKINLEDVDSFIHFSKEIGATNVKLRRLIASGSGYQNHSLLGLSKEEIKSIIATTTTVYAPRPFQCGIEVAVEQAPFGILFSGDREALVSAGTCTGCSAGIALCVIGPDGGFRACPSIPSSIADTKNDSLVSIWTSNSILMALRDRTNLTGRCGQCTYRQICGGCRADAFCLSGDLFGEDPSCWYLPQTTLT